MIGKLGCKTRMCLIRLGCNQNAGCFLVEAVDNTGSPDPANPLEAVTAMIQQGVDKSTAPIARCRMDHHACRLVDDDQVLVLIQDFQRDVLRLRLGIVGFGHLQHDDVIGLEAVIGFRTGLVIASDRTLVDQCLDAGARHMLWHLACQPRVKALANTGLINHELLCQGFPFEFIRYRRRHHEVLPQMLGCEHEQGGFAMNAHETMDEEKPLDPATERVRKKMVRLLAISIGVMMIGLMAVLGAVVYKINGKPDESVAAAPGAKVPIEPGFEGRIDLPEGAEIVSASLDGTNILLTIRLAGAGSQLLVYSISGDRILARVAID